MVFFWPLLNKLNTQIKLQAQEDRQTAVVVLQNFKVCAEG